MIKLRKREIIMKEIKNENKKSKLIFDAKIARKLLKQGFVVIDIKPNRDNVDKSIFVFENTEEFQHALAKIMDDIKTKTEIKHESKINDEDVEKLAVDLD